MTGKSPLYEVPQFGHLGIVVLSNKTKKSYPVGDKIKLMDGLQLLTGTNKGDRLFHIQMVVVGEIWVLSH
jgi:hypothetical protein